MKNVFIKIAIIDFVILLILSAIIVFQAITINKLKKTTCEQAIECVENDIHCLSKMLYKFSPK